MLDRINRRKDGSTPEIVGNLRGLELEIPDLCRALQTSLDGGLDNDVVTALLEQSGVPPKDKVLQELEDLKLIRCIRSGVMVSVRPSNLVPGISQTSLKLLPTCDTTKNISFVTEFSKLKKISSNFKDF